MSGQHGSLDCVLAALEYRALPPTDARLLLWLGERDSTPAELAQALDQAPTAIEQAARRLDMRGLVRRQFEPGRQSRFIFSITPDGLRCRDLLAKCVAHDR